MARQMRGVLDFELIFADLQLSILDHIPETRGNQWEIFLMMRETKVPWPILVHHIIQCIVIPEV